MANYVTPPTIRKKKPDFWGGFATALAAEVKRRAALKDAMEQFKAQQDMTLAKQKELATFNTNEEVRGMGLKQPLERAAAQSKSDISFYGQPLEQAPITAIEDLSVPEDYYGMDVERDEYGQPSKEIYEKWVRENLVPSIRRRSAQMKQNVIQTPEDVAKEAAKKEAEARKAARDSESAAQKHQYRLEEIQHRSSLAKEAKGAGVDTKIISGALSAYNSSANSVRRAYGTEDEAKKAGAEAFQNYVQTFEDYGHGIEKAAPGVATPQSGTAGADTTSTLTPAPVIGEAGAASLVAEFKNPSTTPARREEIKKLLAAYKAQKR